MEKNVKVQHLSNNENIFIKCPQNKNCISSICDQYLDMQSLNINEWKLLELQITQTRHHLSILDEQNV